VPGEVPPDLLTTEVRRLSPNTIYDDGVELPDR
jgi:hypothetical protein